MPRHTLDEAPKQTLEEQKADQKREELKQNERQEFDDNENEKWEQFLSNLFWISLGLFALGFYLVDISLDSDSSLFYILGMGAGALGWLGLVIWAFLAFHHYTGL